MQGEGSYIKKGVGHAMFTMYPHRGVGHDIYNLMVILEIKIDKTPQRLTVSVLHY